MEIAAIEKANETVNDIRTIIKGLINAGKTKSQTDKHHK